MSFLICLALILYIYTGNNTFFFVIFMLLCIMISIRRTTFKTKKEKERGKIKMPTEIMKEFIGKVCAIALVGGFSSVKGKIVSVEADWIKIEESSDIIFSVSQKKKNTTTRIINCNMISEIEILPEKYQK